MPELPWRTGAVVVAVAGAFGAGVVFGSTPSGHTSEHTGSLDRAADQIAAHALTPVDRSTLDRAAIDGMLSAIGDRYAADLGMTPLQRGAASAATDVVIRTPAPGFVLVRVAAFDQGVGSLVRSAVSRFQAAHVRAAVLDLRADPGGLLSEAVATASAFLRGGPVVSYVGRDAAPHVLDAAAYGDTTTPLVVLVDGGTASAAEVVAAALQERGRAVVVGTRTFGKGSVQAPVRLADGSTVELTVGRYLTANGHSLDGRGVTPDIEVSSSANPAVAEARALAVAAGLAAEVAPRDHDEQR